MPLITWWSEPIASANTVLIKDYTVTVTITTARHVRHKVVYGQTHAHATAREIADGTANAIERAYCGVALSIWCGPVVFGPEHRGHLPSEGFYVDGRRVSLSHSEKENEQ